MTTMMNVTLKPVEGTIHYNVLVNGVDLSRFITAVRATAGVGEVPEVEITFIGHLDMVNVPADVMAIIEELEPDFEGLGDRGKKAGRLFAEGG